MPSCGCGAVIIVTLLLYDTPGKWSATLTGCSKLLYMKVSVFRVEKPNGDGPYADDADKNLYDHMNAVHGDADHPDPEDDPMLGGINPEEHCGFATLCDLEAWFAGYEDILHECGYGISVYTLPLALVRWGNNQALFVRGDAVPVRTMTMR